MSFQPSRSDINAWAKGGKMINEFTGEIVRVQVAAKDAMDVFRGLTPIFNSVKKAAKGMEVFLNLKPLAKQMNKSKFKKAVKSLSDMYKNMLSFVGAGVIGEFKSLFESLSGLETVLTLLSPTLSAISAIFAEAMAPVLQELIPYMVLAAQWLLQNKDIVLLFISVLNPLFLILQIITSLVSGKMTPALQSFKLILDGLALIWKGIVTLYNASFKVVFTGLALIWKGLLGIYNTYVKPVFVALVLAFVSIQTIYNTFLKPAFTGIITTLGFVKTGIKGFLKALKDIVNDVLIKPVNKAIKTINTITGLDIKKIPKLATGGYVPPTPGGRLVNIAEGGEGEHVIRESEMSEVASGIQELVMLTKMSLREQKQQQRAKARRRYE